MNIIIPTSNGKCFKFTRLYFSEKKGILFDIFVSRNTLIKFLVLRIKICYIYY